MNGDRYFTKSGILVEERGRKFSSDGTERIDAYRVPSGGRMGWLKLSGLELTGKAAAAAATKQLCAKHLPGNAQCPYRVVYEIKWTPHRLEPVGMFTRRVCLHHLAPAIDDALGDSARGDDVHVCVVA